MKVNNGCAALVQGVIFQLLCKSFLFRRVIHPTVIDEQVFPCCEIRLPQRVLDGVDTQVHFPVAGHDGEGQGVDDLLGVAQSLQGLVHLFFVGVLEHVVSVQFIGVEVLHIGQIFIEEIIKIVDLVVTGAAGLIVEEIDLHALRRGFVILGLLSLGAAAEGCCQQQKRHKQGKQSVHNVLLRNQRRLR